ncbi:MAG: hypothetical protein ACAI25_11370 [Planctomycetota bacterium]
MNAAVCARCGDFLAEGLEGLCPPCISRPTPPRPWWVTLLVAAAISMHFLGGAGWNGFVLLWGGMVFVFNGAFDSAVYERGLLAFALMGHLGGVAAAAGVLCLGSRGAACASLVLPWVLGLLWVAIFRTALCDGAEFQRIGAEAWPLIPFAIQFVLSAPAALRVLIRL